MYQLAEDVTIRNNLQTHYQDYLNKHFRKSFRMVGYLPKNMELENHFVNPSTNLPIDDPIFFGQVDPLEEEQMVATPGYVCHFFILSVLKVSANTPRPRRTRTIFVRQPQAQVQQRYAQHPEPQAQPVPEAQPSNPHVVRQQPGNAAGIPMAEAVDRVEQEDLSQDENAMQRNQFGRGITNMSRG